MPRLNCTVALIVAFLLSLSSVSLAASYLEIDTPLLKAMMDKDKEKKILVVFPFSQIEYNDLHIAGSVNIPLGDLKKKLPADRDRPLVFYCLGEKCTASWRAAEIAVDLGYQRVYAYRPGLPAWVAAGYPTESIEALPKMQVQKISTAELQKRLQSDDNFILLDSSLEADNEKFHSTLPNGFTSPWKSCMSVIQSFRATKRLPSSA